MAKERRSSRKRKSKASVTASSSMYLGYVQEDESVEMIMKKFDKLKEIEESKDNNEKLTEKEMEDLFVQTSTFNPDMLEEDNDENEDDFSEDEGWMGNWVKTGRNAKGEKVYLFEDSQDLWDDILKPAKTTSRVSSANKRKPVRKDNGKIAEDFAYVKIPSTSLPMSWGTNIQPYTPPEFIHTKVDWKAGEITNHEVDFCQEDPQASFLLETPNPLNFDIAKALEEKVPQFQGIVLSPPWKERFGTNHLFPNGIVPSDLRDLNLDNQNLIKNGFVYCWTPKHLIAEVVDVMRSLNLYYVENAIAVRLRPGRSPHEKGCTVEYDGCVMKQVKETCLIFRKGYLKASGKREWTKVEIRHQRTSDVDFSVLDGDMFANEYLYNLVETMVPHGRYNGEGTSGKLLHVWADSAKRTGWVNVVQRA